MRLATIEQMREVEEIADKVYSLSGEILMETAGSGAAREIDQAFYPELKKGPLSIVCGPGNNGGDGLVVARHLHSMGHRDLTVFFVAPEKKRSELFSIQFKRAELMGLRLVNLQQFPEKVEQIEASHLVVDAVFGIGLERDIKDPYEDLVNVINRAKAPVVSLDIPSGIDGNRGKVLGTAIRAEMTITFGLAKPGFFVCEGPLHVGRLRILPIGFPLEVLRGVAVTYFGFNERLARRYLPSRPAAANKSDFGHLLVIAGSPGTWGAAVLAATSAYRVGAGYVTLASFEDPSEVVGTIPEVLTARVDDEKIWNNAKIKTVAIGPGLGVNEKTAGIIERLKEKKFEQVVVDADALTTCAKFGLFPLPKTWTITPHVGELSRLIDVESRMIEGDRYNFALEATKKLGCHVLLKGFRTVLAYEDRCMVIMSGNSALAKAGTGDVLTGMIGGLFAQGMPTLQATATAAYVHGRLGDEWVRVGNDQRSLCASDLKDHLPALLGRITGGAL